MYCFPTKIKFKNDPNNKGVYKAKLKLKKKNREGIKINSKIDNYKEILQL